MEAELQRIQIIGLHGTNKKIDARFIDNTLILVGENGSGKTTFLRILFNILARRWQALRLFHFESIILTLNNTDIQLNCSDLNSRKPNKYEKKMDSFARNMPRKVRETFFELIESGEFRRDPESLRILANRYDVPFGFLLEVAEIESLAPQGYFIQNL
jgi:predicted ATP-binding protein involved in virulence